MIFVVDDDEIMCECIERACGDEVYTWGFSNAIEMMQAIAEGTMPDLIFLDVLLDGPDGFALMHEMSSYADTAEVPIVLVTSLDLTGRDLSAYGVVGVIPKDQMTPEEIRKYARKYDRPF